MLEQATPCCVLLYRKSSGHVLCTFHNDQKVDHTLPQQLLSDQLNYSPPVHLLNIVTGHCTSE